MPSARLLQALGSQGFEMFFRLFFLFLLSPFCLANDFCSYKDTNSLVWNDAFSKAIENFFGSARADFYWPNGMISDQVIEGLGGPPDAIRTLPFNSVIASACRAHSCTEKAAVIISCPSSLLAVAILHFNCSAKNCSDNATTTIFFNNSNPSQHGKDELESWAKDEASKDGNSVKFQYKRQPKNHI